LAAVVRLLTTEKKIADEVKVVGCGLWNVVIEVERNPDKLN